jgi:hypothetical protein
MSISGSTSDSTQLTVASAQAILKRFDCNRQDRTDNQPDRPTLRQALLLMVRHSDYQMLGICADAIAPAQQALETYAKALGYSPKFSPTAIEGAVYLKFNPKSGKCYADSYTGSHRGVLVSCQSADESDINDTFGHLPLDLFQD